jgi:ATP-dependent DNA ligase
MSGFLKPMGASLINWERVEYPCFIQPKLDGVRCVTDGRRFWTRNGNLFPASNVAHLQTRLKCPRLIDGELIIPKQKLQTIVSVTKRANHPEARAIQFHVFDIVDRHLPFSLRWLQIRDFVSQARFHDAQNWRSVRTDRVFLHAELDDIGEAHLNRGYEGSIIRLPDGMYESRKSPNVMKWKPVQDAEFEIIKVVEAKGKDAGTPVFIVDCGNDIACRVRPMGTLAQRRAMWADRKRLLGRQLTVEFLARTSDGSLREPRGKVIRDYE